MRIVYAPTRETVSSEDDAGFVACLRRGEPFAVRVRGIRGISGDRRDVFCARGAALRWDTRPRSIRDVSTLVLTQTLQPRNITQPWT